MRIDNIDNYEELENAMRLYLIGGGGKKLLPKIVDAVKSIDGARQIVLAKMKYESRAIRFFDTDDQIKILSQKLNSIKKDNDLAYNTHWLLVYASKEAKTKAISEASEYSVRRVMNEIKSSINVIGNRFCDLCEWWDDRTTFFSRRYEKRTWKKLYNLCEKILREREG